MKKILKIFLLITAFGLFNTAHAKIPLYFGEQDYFENIESVEPIKDGSNTYNLGYRLYIKWFLGGVYLKDEGYILINNHDKNRYIPLTPEIIQELQDNNFLPKELPNYSISTIYYLKGYSLWIIIIIFVLVTLISNRKEKAKAEKNTQPIV